MQFLRNNPEQLWAIPRLKLSTTTQFGSVNHIPIFSDNALFLIQPVAKAQEIKSRSLDWAKVKQGKHPKNNSSTAQIRFSNSPKSIISRYKKKLIKNLAKAGLEIKNSSSSFLQNPIIAAVSIFLSARPSLSRLHSRAQPSNYVSRKPIAQ